jgi:hypothetical protein
MILLTALPALRGHRERRGRLATRAVRKGHRELSVRRVFKVTRVCRELSAYKVFKDTRVFKARRVFLERKDHLAAHLVHRVFRE